ncbi:NAD(P)/FAD-dependent oxidoreductase [Streptomyces sp. MMG1121]|uniref:NAD(P)/FAD-dependent oxidoreductase n=1 Tax=Streptomyces sp. MMG1121 TaxID=1415544 RepID=UPI0006AFED51|nr:FAD-dependent oxidoreductase [Streptomyces sp. MMG1121]KOV64052.1 FAD-dependent oxidoreductase [Streptomyces sp. MMG1121]
MPRCADVAVVGGGVVGCLIARHITERAPGSSVVLLDRETVGSGASRRSAGLHCPRGATERVRRMARYSQDYYDELKVRHPALPIHQVDLSVVATETSEPELREIYLDSARLTRTDDLPDGPPGIRRPANSQVFTCEGAQYADVYALVQALAHELRHVVTFREGVAVEAVDPDAHDTFGGDVVALRLSTGETLTARQVVVAPGPWLAAPAWRELVAPLGARIKKIIALHIDQSPADGHRTIVFHDEDSFLLPLRDRGHWLFSYTCQEWDVDPAATADGLSYDNAVEARESLRRHAPDLAEHAPSGRVFCDAYSVGGEPEVRALDTAGRVVFAGAANGSGYRLAPAIASDAVDLLRLPDPRPRPAQNRRSQP